MACNNLSGCFTDKQIDRLNDKFSNELPFQLGCLLDEIFFKIIAGGGTIADHNICDHLDVPTDSNGQPTLICITDGQCEYLTKDEIFQMFESVTSLVVDPASCDLVFTDELGVQSRIEMPTLTFDAATNELVWTNWKGVETRFEFPSSDCIENGTSSLCVLTDGCLQTTDYGQGTFENNNVDYLLGVDDTGKIVEMSIFNEKNDIKILCDTGNNNTSYLCCYRQDLTTGAVTITTTELDGTTPYTVVGDPEIPEKVNSETETVKETVSSEKVVYDGTAVSVINRPPDASCAYLSVESADGLGIRGYWDGVSTPTNTDGHLFNDCSNFALGTSDSGLIDANELDNFQFIGSDPNTQGCVWITYYKEI